ALDQIVTDISSQTDRPFIPAELDLENGQISYKNGQPGLSLDQANLKSAVYQSISNWNVNDVINLRIQAVGVLPDNNQVNSAKSRAQKLIGKSMVLENEISNVTVDDKTLIGWLDFNNGYSEDKIQNYIVNLAPSLKRDPVNAEFNFENGVVTQFRPAQTGLAVDGVALLETLKQKLPLLENGADKTLSYKIPVRSTDPLVKTEDVNNLGIKELLGRGTSTFHHSNETRNFNVQKGASIVNRILVAPGETFSFLKNLGDVSVDSGYKQAYIIRQGHTELDAGGGICQVSTTLFRAMLNAGLNVTSRQNHAYRVSYYEEDMPPGYDATVFIPAPDLKFINDTGHYVLIQNSYDGKNRSLTYEIYGTSDGRKVEISNYRQWGASPPPPDIYIDDPTLAPGQVVQDEHRIPGLKTSFDWKVTRNGQVINQKTFTSVYTPWAAVFRRGPQL
ncbi:MAG TPA: VanW family protein, partial [Patescibacteria group bacterium]